MMIIVAVRNFETKKLLGFFWAYDHDNLWWGVDAVAEPSVYEWAKLKAGGLYYPEEERDLSDIILADDDDDKDEPPEADLHDYSISGLHLHEGTWHDLNDVKKWKRFDYATEGHGGIASLKREMDRKRPTKRTTRRAFEIVHTLS